MAIKTVGAYQIAVLATKDASALASWLKTNQYYFPTNKTDVLDSYIKQQWWDSKKSSFEVQLHPEELWPQLVHPFGITPDKTPPSNFQPPVASPPGN